MKLERLWKTAPLKSSNDAVIIGGGIHGLYLNPSREITHPILGAMFHAPGGILRHDGVTWGLARGAVRLGVHIQHILTHISRKHYEYQSIRTSRNTNPRFPGPNRRETS